VALEAAQQVTNDETALKTVLQTISPEQQKTTELPFVQWPAVTPSSTVIGTHVDETAIIS
jgi:hypothetical protein